MGRMPACRPAQQDRDLVRDLPVPLGRQHAAEQRVVPVGRAVVAERLDEAVFPAEPLQRPGATRAAGQGVRQVPRHLSGDAGPQHEQPGFRRLPAQHLVPEIVGDQRLVARDIGDPPALLHLAADAHGREPEPGHPPFGAPQHLVPRAGIHLQAQHREIRVGFLDRAGQIRRGHVGEVAGDPQPGQLEPRRAAPAQDEPQRGRRMPDQQVQPGQHGTVRELVNVVQHQGHGLGEQLGRLHQAQRKRVRREIRQRPRDVRGDDIRSGQGSLDVGPEACRIPVIGIERQPGHTARRGRGRRPQTARDRLPRACRPGHDGHPVACGLLEQVDQPPPAQGSQAQPRYPQLVPEKFRPVRGRHPHPARRSRPTGRAGHESPAGQPAGTSKQKVEVLTLPGARAAAALSPAYPPRPVPIAPDRDSPGGVTRLG